jgi:hypothetical protein
VWGSNELGLPEVGVFARASGTIFVLGLQAIAASPTKKSDAAKDGTLSYCKHVIRYEFGARIEVMGGGQIIMMICPRF